MSEMSPKRSGNVSRPIRKRSSASSTGDIGISTKPEDVTMQSNNLLELAGAVSSGAVRVVDLTFTLSPDFPVIVLPPEFGQAAPVRIQEISRYDGRGPAWYWNNVTFGEHTGTHFDAPIHWYTGRYLPNNSVDTMPVRDMIAMACTIDCSTEAAVNDDFLLTVSKIKDWERQHGRIPDRN